MNLTFNGRPVEAELEYGRSDCDTYIGQAWYLDGDCRALTEDECEACYNESQSEIAEHSMERHGYWRD